MPPICRRGVVPLVRHWGASLLRPCAPDASVVRSVETLGIAPASIVLFGRSIGRFPFSHTPATHTHATDALTHRTVAVLS